MLIDVLSFTKDGMHLAELLKEAVEKQTEHICCLATKHDNANPIEESIYMFAKNAFEKQHALLFIGSTGIAVRAIAGCVEDKFTDVPVLVLDESGTFLIPLLSGHLGGANELALVIAEAVHAVPVITTATDRREAFSVDLFAKEHNLGIINRDKIKEVSTKAIEGKPIRLIVSQESSDENADVYIPNLLRLCPKEYALGIGCKKGKKLEEIEAFVKETLEANHMNLAQIGCVASVSLKAQEEGLVAFGRKYKIPFVTYEPSVLKKVQGDFTSSAFVEETIGVDNVCERSAMAAIGNDAKLICPKTARNGMTLAIAKKDYFRLKENTIYVVGMGPGEEEMMTEQALSVLDAADVIIGYPVYLDLLGSRFAQKEFLSTPMKQEVRRCEMCFEEVQKGKKVAMICSGDAGVYGMASLLLEMRNNNPSIDVEVVPGITAAISGAAVLGAPLNHDFCIISLSDLLTPWEMIEKRLRAAAEADFAIALYNPSSKKRSDYLSRACTILLESRSPQNACGYVENIGREGTSAHVCTLEELKETSVNMFTTVFVGNSMTKIMDGRLVTPRGYRID